MKAYVNKKRHQIHLSESAIVAEAVGSRYGKPVLLRIDSKEMAKHCFEFYQTINDVWLVDHVPVEYINKN